MKPPVEHVRVSAKGKEILLKIKRRTGLEHWNEICRIALCRSLANPTIPPKIDKVGESAITMEWKTFAGFLQNELSATIVLRAHCDGIDVKNREAINDYLRCHLERGIITLQNLKSLSQLLTIS